MSRRWVVGVVGTVGTVCLTGCGTPSRSDDWQVALEGQPGALLSVWGSASDDVWVVGADAQDGTGPLVFHYDGEDWTRRETGLGQGTLWWVYGFAGGPVFMGGEGGVILRYLDGEFSGTEVPGTETVYGIWGTSADDVWAVGGASESMGGFAWRWRGEEWDPEPSFPAQISEDSAVWKTFGTSTDDAWFVGSNGVALHWNGSDFTETDTGIGSSLFTVHAQGDRVAAVGGLASGSIVEYDGEVWHDATPESSPLSLSGVCLGAGESGTAVGTNGTVLTRDADGWTEIDTELDLEESLHAVWLDEHGDAWAVGGQTQSPPLTDGILIHRSSGALGPEERGGS